MNIYKLNQLIVNKIRQKRKEAIEVLASVPDIWVLHILKLAEANETDDDLKHLAQRACKVCEANLVHRILKYIPGLKKGTGNIKDVISGALNSPNPKLQTAAIRSITLARNVGLIDTICSLSNKTKSTTVIIECLKSLGFMGQKKEAFFLTGFTTHPEKYVRSAALVALSMIDKSLTWSLIIEIAGSSSKHLATEAVAILHGLREDRLKRIFSFMLYGQDEKKAEAAIKVIAKLGNQSYLSTLKPIVLENQSERKKKVIVVLKILEKKNVKGTGELLKLARSSTKADFSQSHNNESLDAGATFLNGLSMLKQLGPQKIAESTEREIDTSWTEIKSSVIGNPLVEMAKLKLRQKEHLQTCDNTDEEVTDTEDEHVADENNLAAPDSESKCTEINNKSNEEASIHKGSDLEIARKAIFSVSLESQIVLLPSELKETNKGSTGREKTAAICALFTASLIYILPVIVYSVCLFTLHLAERRALLDQQIWTIPPLVIMILTAWILIPNKRYQGFVWIDKINENTKLTRAIASVIRKTNSNNIEDIAISQNPLFFAGPVSSLPLLPLVAGNMIRLNGTILGSLSVRELKTLVAAELLLNKERSDPFQRYLQTFVDDLDWLMKCYGRPTLSLNPLYLYAKILKPIIVRMISPDWTEHRLTSDRQTSKLYGSNIYAQTLTSYFVLLEGIKKLNLLKLCAPSKNENIFNKLQGQLNNFNLKHGDKTKTRILSTKNNDYHFLPQLAKRLTIIAKQQTERTRIIHHAVTLFDSPEKISADLIEDIKESINL